MNPERLEIAKRLIACKAWKPLRGMQGIVIDGWAAGEGRTLFFDGSAWADSVGDPIYTECTVVPDLDDELTQLGLVGVVRAAWGDPRTYFTNCRDPDEHTPPCLLFITVHGNVPLYCFEGVGEIEATCRALEAAP